MVRKESIILFNNEVEDEIRCSNEKIIQVVPAWKIMLANNISENSGVGIGKG